MEIAFVIIGLAAGGAAGWFMARLKAAAEKQKDHSAWLIEQEKTRNLQVLLDEAKELVERERQKVIELNNTLAASEADYRNLEEKLMERKQEMDDKYEISQRHGYAKGFGRAKE